MGTKQHGVTAGTERVSVPVSRTDRRRRRTWSLWLLLLAAAVLVYGLVVIAPAAIGIRGDLLRGRSAMERGRTELRAADARAAAASFAQGHDLFSAAEGRARGPLLRPVSWLPVVGRTLDAVTAIAGSGATTAQAAGLVAEAMADLPGGLEGLAPAGGRIPLERIPPLARSAQEAEDLMKGAVERLGASPDSLLIGPVAEARRDAERQVGDVEDAVRTAAGLLAGLPEFLGSEGPRTYFFGAGNPAELRGTGGHIGAYSLLTVRDGRLRFSPFEPVDRVPHAPLGQVPPPNEDYARNYDQFRDQGHFWSSVNVMPDFPSVAQAILNGYESGTGRRLDGVIVVDPFALAALLDATGPVDLPGYGVQIDAANVVPFTTNEAYSLFDDSARRKRVLGDVARVAFERFMAQPVDVQDLRGLLEAMGDRHVQVYSEEPAMEDALRSTPAGGTLVPPGSDGDFVSIVISSGAGSKVDFYQRRHIDFAVALHDDGSATATTEVVLRNTAPTEGQPAYVLGTPGVIEEPGDSIALLNLYCGTDCLPGDGRLNGEPIDLPIHTDLGARYVQHYYPVRAGEEVALEVGWDDPTAWVGNSSGGSFRTTFANQRTVAPAVVRIRIEPPPGMDVVEATEPLRIVDGVAVYEGTLDSRVDLEVEFAPSLPMRLWRNVIRFLDTPVVEV